LHLTLDQSRYEQTEIEDLLTFSGLDEWKVCTTAWFLSQCVGNSNLSMPLSLLRRGSLPSSLMRRFACDVPQHLEHHLSRCAQCLTNPTIGTALETLRHMVVSACSPAPRHVSVVGQRFSPLDGTWPERGASAAWPPSDSSAAVCLSDVLRGSIVLCECEYTCMAMRDLLLLCAYTGRDTAVDGVQTLGSDWPMHVDGFAWTPLSELLDEQLPIFTSLHRSMQSELPCTEVGPRTASVAALRYASPSPMVARGCDVWAVSYRSSVGGRSLGLRPPAASFKSFRYAVQLLRREGWDAVRWWSRHHQAKEIAAYLAGRQWVATGRCDLAREAFIHAENVANIVMECLPGSELCGAPFEAGPDIVAYYVHVASLFSSSSKGHLSDEYLFMRKAAHMAEELSLQGSANRSLCQRLWSSIFENAISLELWDEAHDALLRIDSFESCVRLLAQKLRSCGRMDLMLQLPEKHKAVFMNSLHEQASLSPPTLGSDSLACYHQIYALHFSGEEYLKAATVAHSMYRSLSDALQHFMRSQPADSECQNLQLGARPQERALVRPAPGPREKAQARAADHVWPLLEQQRNALLMLISALSLTPEQTMLVPLPGAAVSFGGRHGSKADQGAPAAKDLGAALGMAPSEVESFRQFYAEAEVSAKAVTFTLADAERALAVAEANMVLCGQNEVRTASDAASSVASLGLLMLALRITQSHGLDPWKLALQPFLRLCLEAEHSTDDRVAGLIDAARGPAQAYMFVQSDGCEPLGVGGSTRTGLWQALEEGLGAVAGAQGAGQPLDASATRLYSLVADEILSSHRGLEKLPEFLAGALASGPSWVCLLRMYVKHDRFKDAVELLEEQLKACGPGPKRWSPLQDFPVSLVLQLQRRVSQSADKEKSGQDVQRATKLESILAQFQRLLTDSEWSPDCLA